MHVAQATLINIIAYKQQQINSVTLKQLTDSV